MSYILDALRRADAERARGAVPTLHAQPRPPPPHAAAGEVRATPWRWLLAGATLCALLALAGWLAVRPSAGWQAGAPTQAVQLSTPPGGTQTPSPTPVPVPVPVPVPANSLPTALPPASSLPVIALPAPPARPASPATPAAAAIPVAPRRSPVASAPASVPSRVPLLGELPDGLRRQLPVLAFSGSVYSDQPASRFVMINGQLLREGDSVAPGLLLERIQPKSVLLRWRDQRFEVVY